jgi:hypothetical protein
MLCQSLQSQSFVSCALNTEEIILKNDSESIMKAFTMYFCVYITNRILYYGPPCLNLKEALSKS